MRLDQVKQPVANISVLWYLGGGGGEDSLVDRQRWHSRDPDTCTSNLKEIPAGWEVLCQ